MVSLNRAEERILISLRALAITCKKYEENFDEEKLKSIKDNYIEPVISKMGKELLETFENLKPIIKEMNERDILDKN